MTNRGLKNKTYILIIIRNWIIIFCLVTFPVISVGLATPDQHDSQRVTIPELGKEKSNRVNLENGSVTSAETSRFLASRTQRSDEYVQSPIKSPQWIPDPTGKTTGYSLDEYPTKVFELKSARGQTYRHFYNKATGEYTYQSDFLVQKKG